MKVPEIIDTNLVEEIRKGRDSVRSDSDWVSEEEMLFHFKIQTDGELRNEVRDDECT